MGSDLKGVTMFRSFLLSTLAVTVLSSIPGLCSQLVINGNFASGNTGFLSQYSFVTDADSNCSAAATYTIGTNPNSCLSGWSSFGPFDPTGNMMIINGAASSGVVVWSETVSIVPSSAYFFSFMVSPNSVGTPVELGVSFNGTEVATLGANILPGEWGGGGSLWDSRTNTSAVLAIVDLNTGASANNFSLDDISFTGPAPSPVPESSSGLLLGLPFALFLTSLLRGSRVLPLRRR